MVFDFKRIIIKILFDLLLAMHLYNVIGLSINYIWDLMDLFFFYNKFKIRDLSLIDIFNLLPINSRIFEMVV